MADEVRAFIALELDDALRQRLARILEGLRTLVPDVRFSGVENAHLTLRFLGPSSPAALERIAGAIAAAAAACPAADVPVTGLGLFPPHGPPKVLWLGFGLPAPMLALQAECERVARSAGFEPDTRVFRPHLTIGRWRDRARRPSLPDVDPFTARIDRATLFRSDLEPTGAVHTPLGVFPLGAAILPPLP